MAFVIRTVSHSAAGREIARVRRIDGDTVSIGRDPASDIHLPDLAVTRHHAVLRLEATGRVAVEAADNLPIDVDGKAVRQATIDLASGGEIVAGAFRIVVGAGEVPGEATVLVERIAVAPTRARDERQRFSLAGVAPGKRKTAWLLAIAIVAAFLVWPIWSFHASANARLSPAQIAGAAANPHADAAWSPGKLSLAHAGLEGNCIACHKQAFVAVSDDACKSCHMTVHDHADPARLAAARSAPDMGGRVRLTIARVFGRPDGRCADCHQEHLGAIAMAPTPQRFCADCHADLKAKLPDTRLENASDFGTAHPEFRPAIVLRPGADPLIERRSLASRPQQDTGLIFPHALHLSATNGCRPDGAIARPGGRREGAGLCRMPCRQCGGQLQGGQHGGQLPVLPLARVHARRRHRPHATPRRSAPGGGRTSRFLRRPRAGAPFGPRRFGPSPAGGFRRGEPPGHVRRSAGQPRRTGDAGGARAVRPRRRVC